MSLKPYIEAGSRLKTFRENYINLSQVELVKELNLSQKAYSFYESGYRFPKNETLSALNKKYKLNTEWLISGKGEPISNKKFNPDSDSNLKTRVYLLEAQVSQLEEIIETVLKKLEAE